MHAPRRWLALMALAGFASACSVTPSATPPLGEHRAIEPKRGGIFRAAMAADVRNLDAAVAFDGASHVFLQFLYDTLVSYDPDGNLVPDLAERYEVSPDGLSYTFTLRQNVRFHDGEELTAHDVKRSLERTLHHDTPCPVPSFYNRIRGYEAFHDGIPGPDGKPTYADELEGVIVEGRYVLRIELKEPDATFLPVMTLAFAAPVCKSAGSTFTREWGNHPCGTGPFELEAWEPGREIRLRRHEGYFRPELPYLDGITWQLLMPPLTQRFKFETGELDYLREMRHSDLVRYLNDPQWKPYAQWSFSKSILGIFMNTQMPPFDNVELRRAVAAAIDWDEIAKLREGQLVRATQMVPPAVPGHDPTFEGQRFDPEKALQHMKNAGYPFDPKTGKGGLPEVVRYVGNADGFDTQAAQVIQQRLAKIGIRMTIKIVSWPTFLAITSRRGGAQMGYAGWSLDYPDPSSFFDPTLSSEAIQEEETQNAAFFVNEELDELLRKARREMNPKARAAMYRRAEEIVRDEAPWAIGYGARNLELVQPYVHGYQVDRTHISDVRRVWLDVEERNRVTGRRKGQVEALIRPWGRP